RDVVVVQRLQQLVHLGLGVAAVRFEAVGDVLENHAALTLPRRQPHQAALDEIPEHALLLVGRAGKLALTRRTLTRRATRPAATRRGSTAWTVAMSVLAASAAASTVRAPRATAANTRSRCSSASRPISFAGDVMTQRVADRSRRRQRSVVRCRAQGGQRPGGGYVHRSEQGSCPALR